MRQAAGEKASCGRKPLASWERVQSVGSAASAKDTALGHRDSQALLRAPSKRNRLCWGKIPDSSYSIMREGIGFITAADSSDS